MSEQSAGFGATGAMQSDRAYRAVFFDLDGTLLPMELDEFMRSYFQSLGAYVAQFGVSGESFMAGMKTGIKAMAAHDDGLPNAEAFWGGFFAHVDPAATDWKTQLDAYYDHEFGELGAGMQPDPAAARTVEALAAKGYPLVLTTMPMFPQRAVEWRLTWAGVDSSRFARITSFMNSTSVKPKLTYYAENLAAAGVAGSDILMVGNNTLEDLAVLGLGADAFLVTDHLIDPVQFDLASIKHGSLEELAAWVERLPVCVNPAMDVSTEVVSADVRAQALADNAVDGAAAAVASSSPDGFSINGIED